MVVIIKESFKRHNEKANEQNGQNLKVNAYRLLLLTAHYSSFFSAWHFCCMLSVLQTSSFFRAKNSLIGAEDTVNRIELYLSKLGYKKRANERSTHDWEIAHRKTIWEMWKECRDDQKSMHGKNRFRAKTKIKSNRQNGIKYLYKSQNLGKMKWFGITFFDSGNNRFRVQNFSEICGVCGKFLNSSRYILAAKHRTTTNYWRCISMGIPPLNR